MSEQSEEKRFFWICIDYATFGITAVNGVIRQAAPIASWMIGKELKDIKPFLLEKDAKVVEI